MQNGEKCDIAPNIPDLDKLNGAQMVVTVKQVLQEKKLLPLCRIRFIPRRQQLHLQNQYSTEKSGRAHHKFQNSH